MWVKRIASHSKDDGAQNSLERVTELLQKVLGIVDHP
jgi:hypothetical protein